MEGRHDHLASAFTPKRSPGDREGERLFRDRKSLTRRSHVRSAVRVGLAVGLLAASAVPAAAASMTDLGTLGGPNSQGNAINRRVTSRGTPTGRTLQLYALAGAPRSGGMQDLGSLGGLFSQGARSTRRARSRDSPLYRPACGPTRFGGRLQAASKDLGTFGETQPGERD